MRIAVVAHSLRTAGGLSVGKNIVSSLQRLAPQNTYLFLLPENAGYERLGLDESRHQIVYHAKKFGIAGRFIFDAFQLKRIVRKFKPDVVLCLANQGAGVKSFPQAILCHDPHLFYPVKHYAAETSYRKLLKAYMKQRLACDLNHTQLLLCQTPVAERRMKETFGYTGKTALCPNAVSKFAAIDDEADAAIPEKLAPYKDKFKLFCLTRYYPHKNLESIAAMYEKYRDELRGTAVIITVEKGQHRKGDKFLRDIERRGLNNSIINVGLLQQQELAGYYHACQALFLPTLLESFSGTYIEAMHFGLPILTSDLDFAREVCGQAAVYFDPWNVESIKDTVLRLKNNPQLSQELIARGKEELQSKFLPWDEIVRDLLKNLGKLATKSIS